MGLFLYFVPCFRDWFSPIVRHGTFFLFATASHRAASSSPRIFSKRRSLCVSVDTMCHAPGRTSLCLRACAPCTPAFLLPYPPYSITCLYDTKIFYFYFYFDFSTSQRKFVLVLRNFSLPSATVSLLRYLRFRFSKHRKCVLIIGKSSCLFFLSSFLPSFFVSSFLPSSVASLSGMFFMFPTRMQDSSLVLDDILSPPPIFFLQFTTLYTVLPFCSRFQLSIQFGLPDAPTRREVFGLYAKQLSNKELETLATITAGMSGRDMKVTASSIIIDCRAVCC